MMDFTRFRIHPGFHDEPLKGKRKRQRSMRLSKAYRLLYSIRRVRKGEEFVYIEDVTKHEY
jgi:proteic killer suppression protein